MKITAKWLARRKACVEGAEWFAAHFPQGGEAVEVDVALAEAFCEITARVAATDPKKAERIAARIEDANWRDSAFTGIALKVAKKDLAAAKRIAAKIEDADWRDWTLCEIAWVAAN